MSYKRHKETHCPVCNKKIDAAAPVDGVVVIKPKDGNVGICFGCGAILVYKIPKKGHLYLELMTQDEHKQYKKEEPVKYARTVFLSMQAKKKQPGTAVSELIWKMPSDN